MASENKDEMAGEDFAARLRSLITRFGFRPDEVNVSSRFGVGTISFKNQKGKATELVSKLRGAMKQMGVPEAAITAREVQYPADADGPAEHWGVVNVDFNKMPHAKSGKKDTMAVEDRFYFGKGRKEQFASKEQAVAFIRQYKRNEASNAHSENVVLLAKFMGNARIAKLASLVQQINEVAGHMPQGVGQFQYNELHSPLWKQFIAQYGDLYASVK